MIKWVWNTLLGPNLGRKAYLNDWKWYVSFKNYKFDFVSLNYVSEYKKQLYTLI